METKTDVHDRIVDFIKNSGLIVAQADFERPWGGFFRIQDKDLLHFIDLFFPDQQELKESAHKLQPKLLAVAPGKRLSWQYHNRRSELWKILEGPVAVMLSDTDAQTPVKLCKVGDVIEISLRQRHRLIGLDNWGLVAEIWRHADVNNPSDESEIVRVQDDFGR
ncbi:MAG: phosphoheptose isomerase [Candidatus Woesebacteria bacterium]